MADAGVLIVGLALLFPLGSPFAFAGDRDGNTGHGGPTTAAASQSKDGKASQADPNQRDTDHHGRRLGPPPIEGSYRGMLSLHDGPPLQIPISLNLNFTDQVEKVETSPGVFEMQKVIDGAFLVDKEGGPYAFTKVVYRFRTSELDMKYSRTKGVTVGQPASFRLVGKVAQDGSVKGRVLSGYKGKMGTFTLYKVPEEALVSKRVYAGFWAGYVTLVPEGERMLFGIAIAPTGLASLNPEQLEFDFSRGKIGHADFNFIQLPLSKVSVDYLHRKVMMSSQGSEGRSVAVEAYYDIKTQHLKGYVSSIYGGEKGYFDIPKVSNYK